MTGKKSKKESKKRADYEEKYSKIQDDILNFAEKHRFNELMKDILYASYSAETEDITTFIINFLLEKKGKRLEDYEKQAIECQKKDEKSENLTKNENNNLVDSPSNMIESNATQKEITLSTLSISHLKLSETLITSKIDLTEQIKEISEKQNEENLNEEADDSDNLIILDNLELEEDEIDVIMNEMNQDEKTKELENTIVTEISSDVFMNFPESLPESSPKKLPNLKTTTDVVLKAEDLENKSLVVTLMDESSSDETSSDECSSTSTSEDETIENIMKELGKYEKMEVRKEEYKSNSTDDFQPDYEPDDD